MNSLTVFYDETCGLCIRCRDWLLTEPQIVRLVLVQKSFLAVRHPSLSKYAGGSDLVAVSDEGDVWVGDAAFITILFALEGYRPWASRLARPSFRPHVRRFFEMVSNNRGRISMLLGASPDDAQLSEYFEEFPQVSCEDGACALAEVEP